MSYYGDNNAYFYSQSDDDDDDEYDDGPSASYYNNNGPNVGIFGQVYNQSSNASEVCYDGASENNNDFQGNGQVSDQSDLYYDGPSENDDDEGNSQVSNQSDDVCYDGASQNDNDEEENSQDSDQSDLCYDGASDNGNDDEGNSQVSDQSDLCYDGASENGNGDEGNSQTVGIFGEVYDSDDDGQNVSDYDYEEVNPSRSVGIFDDDDNNSNENYDDDDQDDDVNVGIFGQTYDDDDQNDGYNTGPSMRSFAGSHSEGPSTPYNPQYDIEQRFSGLTLSHPNNIYNGRSRNQTPKRDSNTNKSNSQTVNMPSGTKSSISRPVHSPCACAPNRVGQHMTLTALSLGVGGDFAIIHAEMHKTLGAHNFSRYHIISIQKVGNCCLWKKFREREKTIANEIGYVNERMLFHGSSATDTIVRTGFDISRANPAGMFGPGAYFAEHSSKSNRYAAAFLGHRKMLICRVALGKMLDRTQADKMNKPPSGYHSVRGVPAPGGLLYPEYVIYHNDQAYPEYVVSYNIG